MTRNLLSPGFDPASTETLTVHDLHVGMRVRVTRNGDEYTETDGFDTYWCDPEMDQCVGFVFEVRVVSSRSGVKLRTEGFLEAEGCDEPADFWFPIQVLEIVGGPS